MISFAISAAVSAASFGAQLLVSKLLAPKRKAEVKGKLTGEITLTDSIWGPSIDWIFGAAPGGRDNFGGMEVGCNIIWASEIRKIQTQVPGGSGGHQGKGGGGGGSNQPSTIQLNYKIDLAAAVGRGRLKLLRVKFNEDVVFGGTAGNTGPEPERYEAEANANTLTGTAHKVSDDDCSGGKKVAGIGPGGSLTFNFSTFDAAAYLPDDPPGPGNPEYPTPAFPHYFFSLYYKSDGDRQAYVKLDGTGGIYTFPDTGGTVGIKFISRRYQESAATLEISNPNADAPEIDCLEVSVELIFEPDGRQTGIRDLNFPPEPAQDNILLPDPLDYDTNALERFNAPVPEPANGVTEYTLANGASLAWYEGTEDQPVDAVIAAALGVNAPAFRGTAYARISDLDFTGYGSVPNLRFLVANLDTNTVAEICTTLALEAGLDESDLDLTICDEMNVRGYIVSGIQPPSKTFEELGLIKNLSFSEDSSGRIVARDLGDRTAAVTIRAADLRAHLASEEESGDGPSDAVVSTIIDESVDLARELEIQFFNPDPPCDYGTDRAKAVYPYTGSNRVETRSVNALLTKAECLEIARRELQKNHVKISPVAFNLPYKYAALEPGDCFDIEIEKNPHRYRLEEKTGSAPGIFECSATNENLIVAGESELETPDGTTGGPIISVPKTKVRIPGGTVGTIIDSSPLSETLPGKNGVYVAAAPRGTGRWDSAIVYRQKGGDWQQVKVLTKPALIGRAADALPTVPTDLNRDGVDTTGSVAVDFFGTDAPTTVTEDSMLDGANPFLVGGEIVTIQTWTRDNDYSNRWIASNIRRALKNTSRFADGHQAGERVVMLTDAVEFIPLDRDEIGTERIWKFVTSGAQIADAAPITFAWAGENLIQGRNFDAPEGKILTAGDDGKTITNRNATGAVEFPLTAPVEEAEYRFAVAAAAPLKVTAPAGHSIRFGKAATAAAGYLRSSAVGSTLCLRVIAGVWTTTDATGEWEVS